MSEENNDMENIRRIVRQVVIFGRIEKENRIKEHLERLRLLHENTFKYYKRHKE